MTGVHLLRRIRVKKMLALVAVGISDWGAEIAGTFKQVQTSGVAGRLQKLSMVARGMRSINLNPLTCGEQ